MIYVIVVVMVVMVMVDQEVEREGWGGEYTGMKHPLKTSFSTEQLKK